MNIKAVRFDKTGGPEVLRYVDIALLPPGPGEVTVRHRAIGVNLIDTYYRKGLYPTALPSGLGVEAAGVVEALGAGVEGLRVGDRVAYVLVMGADAEAANVRADKLVRVPDAIGDEAAAAILLKGMTAEYLLRRTYEVKPRDVIVVHAAAGGVGLIACQWARHLGAEVIGVVGTSGKAALARTYGCAHVVISGRDDLVACVRDVTRGAGVPVVYDSVGRDTFQQSLDCLKPRGLLVSYGNASGPVSGVDLSVLTRGSLYVTRPTLGHYIATPQELAASAGALFELVERGVIKIEIGQRYALKDAAQAHRDLEARRTTGASLLLP